jgi:hypothetical protein
MKLASVLCLACILVSSSVSADNFFRMIPGKQSKTIQIDLPSGKSVVNVSGFPFTRTGDPNSVKMSCYYFDASGNETKQSNVFRCQGITPNLVRPITLTIKIVNEGKDDILYSATVAPTK